MMVQCCCDSGSIDKQSYVLLTLTDKEKYFIESSRTVSSKFDIIVKTMVKGFFIH